MICLCQIDKRQSCHSQVAVIQNHLRHVLTEGTCKLVWSLGMSVEDYLDSLN